MTIPSSRPIAIDRATNRSANEPKAQPQTQTQAAPFSRAPQIATAAAARSAGAVAAAGRTTGVSAVGPTPLKALAEQLCHACEIHQAKLDARGSKNSTYLGSDQGGVVFRNEETGEIGIRHMRIKPGFFNLGNFDTTCLAKKDGRVIFNGETLTEDHPDLPNVKKALESILGKVSNDSLYRHSLMSYTRDAPWNPKSGGYANYVA